MVWKPDLNNARRLNPKGKAKHIVVRVDDATLDKLRTLAANDRKSVAEIVRRILSRI